MAPWKWTSVEQHAFEQAKKIVSQETLLVYLGFNIPLEVYTDASYTQLGAVINQHGMPLAFYLHKFNSVQKTTQLQRGKS
eukprot:7183093-Ditylum_brightwellii.AAC.2